jgi:hypothetical protein
MPKVWVCYKRRYSHSAAELLLDGAHCGPTIADAKPLLRMAEREGKVVRAASA